MIFFPFPFPFLDSKVWKIAPNPKLLCFLSFECLQKVSEFFNLLQFLQANFLKGLLVLVVLKNKLLDLLSLALFAIENTTEFYAIRIREAVGIFLKEKKRRKKKEKKNVTRLKA